MGEGAGGEGGMDHVDWQRWGDKDHSNQHVMEQDSSDSDTEPCMNTSVWKPLIFFKS